MNLFEEFLDRIKNGMHQEPVYLDPTNLISRKKYEDRQKMNNDENQSSHIEIDIKITINDEDE